MSASMDDRPTTRPSTTGIPTGTVAFYFSDVEGSTLLWEESQDHMRKALRRHDEIVRASIEEHGGYIFSMAGDQFVAAFHNAADCAAAAATTQQRLAEESWPERTPIRVRIGIHVGVPEERNDDYFGHVLNRTARIASAGHGSQTLLSGTAAALIGHDRLTDLGEHRLKDLTDAENIWQVGSEQFPALRTLRAGHHNLPIERTPLVGRSDEVATIAQIALDQRLATLLGIGGTGKTRLALAVAAEIADQFEDGTWLVDLVPTNDVDSVVEAIASAAGLRLTSGDLLEALATQAAQRNFLIVLDNCEHVTDDVADVVDLLLERSNRLHVIATSREPLDLPDEQQVRVAPLPVSSSSTSPAVRLFLSAAQRVGAELDDGDIAAVANICTRLDGLPLSIELAAAQLRQLRLPELTERLDRRFELLSRGKSNRRRRRQTSLLEVLEDSWSMLDEPERELLKAIAAFPSSFDLDDVETITGAAASVPRSLGGLADRGLVSSDGRGRSRLLETVKLFVRQQWSDESNGDPDQPDSDPATATATASSRYLDAHTDWLLEHLRLHGADNSYQSASLAGWSIRHYDDHRSVEDRLVASGRLDALAQLIASLCWAYSRESGQRAVAFIERVERYLDELDLGRRQSAALNLAAAGAARAARNRHWLAHGAQEAVRLYRPDGASEELVVALIVASFTEVLKDPDRAFTNLDEAGDLAREIGAETLVDSTLAYRAHYAAMIGNIEDVHEILHDLEPRIASRPVDNTTIMTLQAKMVANLISDPGTALEAAQQCMSKAALLGLDSDWWMHLYLATGAAAIGDGAAMQRHLADADVLLQLSGVDGLPDLLLPYITLAHVRHDVERSRRWVTAVRHANARPGTGVVIALYRRLRTAVGLADTNPLDEATIAEIYADAQAWAARLDTPPLTAELDPSS